MVTQTVRTDPRYKDPKNYGKKVPYTTMYAPALKPNRIKIRSNSKWLVAIDKSNNPEMRGKRKTGRINFVESLSTK